MKKINIKLKKNEEKIIPVVWLDDNSDTEFHYTIDLNEPNSNVVLLGIFLGTQESFLKFDTVVQHTGMNTKSLTILRAVFLGNSKFTNDGMIRINKGAKNTNGFFDSKVLLFNNAKGRSVPSLEIDENEVKAGHGSTIGRPDENQILYLRSRGISEQAAEKLIITGFFDPALKLLDDITKNEISDKISLALENL